jgi:putative acetyltransferase
MELSVRIETGKPDDAAAMVNVHFAAVHQTAASFYPQAIINTWSRPISDERAERIQRAIESSEELFLVAKYAGSIVGFGSVVPKNNELRGLYVHPDYGRRGIGALLLSALELMAVEQGASYLHMDASVNAESLYIKQGYQVIERGTHRLSSGQEMSCVKMQKMLLY